MKFVETTTPPKGKRAGCVAGIIEQLVEADGEPVSFQQLLETVGMEAQSAQMKPAMDALELTGIVKRYTYVESGKTKPRSAYGLNKDAVEVTE